MYSVGRGITKQKVWLCVFRNGAVCVQYLLRLAAFDVYPCLFWLVGNLITANLRVTYMTWRQFFRAWCMSSTNLCSCRMLAGCRSTWWTSVVRDTILAACQHSSPASPSQILTCWRRWCKNEQIQWTIDVRWLLGAQNHTLDKIHDDGGRHLKFGFSHISRSPMKIFSSNLVLPYEGHWGPKSHFWWILDGSDLDKICYADAEWPHMPMTIRKSESKSKP